MIDFYFLKFIFQESIEADKRIIASRLNEDSILAGSLILKSLSVLIYTLGSNLTIAVFLYESAIACILLIVALEALAVLVLLDTEALALAIVIDTLEAVAVGVMYHHVAIDISLLELAFKDVAVLLGQLSPTVLQVVFPAANIDVAILPYESTLSGTLAIHKLSGVFRTAG